MYLGTESRIRVFHLDFHVGEGAEFFHHRKADTCSACAAGHFVFDAVEFLEHLFHFGRGNARTVVAHRQIDIGIFDTELDDNHLVVRIFGELQGVVHQVHQNLHNGVPVHHQGDVPDIGVRRDGELEAVLFHVLAVGGHKVVQYRLGSALAKLHVPTVAIQFRQVKNILD